MSQESEVTVTANKDGTATIDHTDTLTFATLQVKEGGPFVDQAPGWYYTVPAPNLSGAVNIDDIHLKGPFETVELAAKAAEAFIEDCLSSGLELEMIYTGNEDHPDLRKTIAMNVDDEQATMESETSAADRTVHLEQDEVK